MTRIVVEAVVDYDGDGLPEGQLVALTREALSSVFIKFEATVEAMPPDAIVVDGAVLRCDFDCDGCSR